MINIKTAMFADDTKIIKIIIIIYRILVQHNITLNDSILLLCNLSNICTKQQTKPSFCIGQRKKKILPRTNVATPNSIDLSPLLRIPPASRTRETG